MRMGSAATAAFIFVPAIASLVPIAFGQPVLWWTIVGPIAAVGLFAGVSDFLQLRLSVYRNAPQGVETEGNESMIRQAKEAIGKVATLVGIATSYTTLAAYAVLFAAKEWAEKVTIQPLNNVDLHTFVQAWAPIFFWVWIGSNLLAGRWAPATLVKTDRFSSFVACWGIAAIAAYNLVVGNVPLLEATLIGWFGIIPVAAFVDWWFAKSDKFRSSTLTDENSKLVAENVRLTQELASARAQLAAVFPAGAAPPAAHGGTGIYPEIVALMRATGQSEVGPFNVTFKSTVDGIAMVVPDDELLAYMTAHKLKPGGTP